jgi:phosphoribosylanthranilate isomerase
MLRTRIKICGITAPGDARLAAALGADAIGLVFYPPAAAAVSLKAAEQIAGALPPFVSAVALFVNADAGFVREAQAASRAALLQFHGDETAAFCEKFTTPYIAVCRVKNRGDVSRAIKAHPAARGILLDAFAANAPGGSGRVFDWNLIPRRASLPLIIAGGLTPANVGGALASRRFWGADVSSGTRAADNPRRKSRNKIRAFINAVRAADDARETGERQ